MAQAPTETLAADLLARLPATPDVHAHQLDLLRGGVLLVALDAARYRAASFLDERLLQGRPVGAWLPGAAVAAAARASRCARPLHFIVHAGHVGSTLLSRLVDGTGRVLGLREPLPLRTLAEAQDALGRPDALLSPAQFEALAAMLLALWSRGYADTQAVVLKATSHAGRAVPGLVAALPAARCVLLNLRAEPYLATLLAGANSLVDLRAHAPERMRRLRRTSPADLGVVHALSPGELAALGWLAESVTQADLAAGNGPRALAVDFEELLADVPAVLERVLAHLGLAPAPGEAARIAASGLLARYAKGPEHAYSPALRAELLGAARRDAADEIRRGLAWLERAAAAEPRYAAVVAAGS